jgi:hypothetical protein
MSGRSPRVRPRVAAYVNGAGLRLLRREPGDYWSCDTPVVGENSPTSPRAATRLPTAAATDPGVADTGADRPKQLCPVAGSGQRVDPQVVGNVEGWGVTHCGQPSRRLGPVQQLPEARDQGQSRFQQPADSLDTTLARRPGMRSWTAVQSVTRMETTREPGNDADQRYRQDRRTIRPV